MQRIQIKEIGTMILYEDQDVIVINKPAGLAVETRQRGAQDLVNLLKNYRAQNKEEPYIGVIHRLDQPVEGLLVFAKNKKTAAHLSRQVQQHMLTKEYLAVVEGNLPDSQQLVHYLKKNGQTNISQVTEPETEGAKEARLSYQCNQRGDTHSLADIQLETGRHHQIRAQFAAIGHPLAGDARYGKNQTEGTIGLCACHLVFEHPGTGKKMEFRIIPKNPVFDEFFQKEEK